MERGASPRSFELMHSLVRFDTRPQEEELIVAALDLGDWLLLQPELARKDRDIIERAETALRRLPDVTPDLDAEYGFAVRSPFRDGELYRSWAVGICPSSLEIFSIYSPDPRVDIWEEINSELHFYLEPGCPNQHTPSRYKQWMAEVRAAERFRALAAEFEVDVYEVQVNA